MSETNTAEELTLNKLDSGSILANAVDSDAPVEIECRDVNVYYGDKHAIKAVDLDVKKNTVTAFIGPSGCGKSTFLRCINRMNDTIDIARVTGSIKIEDEEVIDPNRDVVLLRRKVGMVFQKPNPFPKSIYDNIAYGPRLHGIADSKADLDGIVEASLRGAGLWEEVKDRLDQPGTGLSGGQQQRLCIARAIAVSPEVVLMDEPCSALDPIATGVVEELIRELKQNFTIVMVTHNMQQAMRVADFTSVFYLGELIEHETTREIFNNPKDERVKNYIMGRTG